MLLCGLFPPVSSVCCAIELDKSTDFLLSHPPSLKQALLPGIT